MSGGFQVRGNINAIVDLFSAIISVIVNIIIIVLGARTLGHSDNVEKEKAYSMFRYIYVMMGIFALLEDAFNLALLNKAFFYSIQNGITRVFLFLAHGALVVLLIKSKPEKPVQKVNLKNYDMVTFTSNGHRFVHYLLDFLFLVPVWLSIFQLLYLISIVSLPGDSNQGLLQLYAEVLLIISYLLYYFLSEAIFRQTFGKMITRSCVVSDGVELSGKRVFLRTLSRLIPFDKFSFLFGSKWHDRASSTAVVYIGSWEVAFEEKQQEVGV
jgi:uncharacterized RDD family membrane protein YckC